jgi:putative hydrolase of HD superfamily
MKFLSRSQKQLTSSREEKLTQEEKDLNGLTEFIFELGQLKRTPRTGWLKLGIKDPETVAEHSFSTAAIGFLLAEMEGLDPYQVAGYCLFHDVAETRTGDLDWLAQKYLDRGNYLSSDVIKDQIAKLPDQIKTSMEELYKDPEEGGEINKLARDADLLDLIFQAIVYVKSGNDGAKEWFDNTIPLLKTDSAREIADNLQERDKDGTLNELIRWWKGAKINSDRDN